MLVQGMTAVAPMRMVAALTIFCLVFLMVGAEALNTNLKYFSVWELESVDPAEALGWTNFLFTAGNVSQLKEWSEAGIGPSLLYVYDVFFSNGMLRPDYQTSWAERFAILKPLLDSKSAMGVFLGDELAWSCIPFSNISAAADLVRLSIPRGSGIIYYNEAYPPFVPDGQAAWKSACPHVEPLIYPRQVGLRLGYFQGLFRSFSRIDDAYLLPCSVPSSLDWISIDYYPGIRPISFFSMLSFSVLTTLSFRRRCLRHVGSSFHIHSTNTAPQQEPSKEQRKLHKLWCIR